MRTRCMTKTEIAFHFVHFCCILADDSTLKNTSFSASSHKDLRHHKDSVSEFDLDVIMRNSK